MTQPQSTPRNHTAGGASHLRTTIVACMCSDEGVCIMCADCGHIFVPSKPLSDESEPIDNTVLSKALWYHMCAMPRASTVKEVRHGRVAKRGR